MRFSLGVLFVLATLPVSLSARGDDSSSAIDELKTGYALKESGRCPEAIPHFVASYRADPKPKALLNLSDCQAQTGDLLSARGYATQGRALADQQHDAELVGVADEQLAAIDKRVPRLTIRLASTAPADSKVARDSVSLGPAALGVVAALNPGPHRIVVTAAGRGDAEFDVTLAEGAAQEIEVHPGAPLTQEARAIPGGHPLAEHVEGSSDGESSPSARTLLTYSAFGLGAVGLTVGIAVGVAATSKHSTLDGECGTGGTHCPLSAQGDLDSFHSLRTVSTIGYVVGAAGVAGGALLWLTAPAVSSKRGEAHVWVGPLSAGVRGAF